MHSEFVNLFMTFMSINYTLSEIDVTIGYLHNFCILYSVMSIEVNYTG